MNAPTRPRWEAIDFSPFLAQVHAGSSATIANARQLAGGASKDVWYFEILGDSAPRPFALRRDSHRLSDSALGIRGEFAAMRAAFEAGVRVPHPHFLGRDADGLDFFIMDFIEGETLAPRLFRHEAYAPARESMTAQFGRLLAPIHRIPAKGDLLDAFGPVPTANPALLALDQYEETFRRISPNPHPVFELAFRDLRRAIPDQWETALVHGDYRLGNVIFGPEGIRAILDWELAHWGDPMEDLAWLAVRAWRFGRDAMPVAGLGRREELHAAYAAAGGLPVDAGRARWWEIFGNLRWGVITIMQAHTYLSGATNDLEKAAIGRRTVEVEAELLNWMK